MGQKKQAGAESLRVTADTLSAMLAQEVRDLNTRQRTARKEKEADPGIMKGMKEVTAMLKDLASVNKTLNEQGTDAGQQRCGVVLLPPVPEEEE